jgi:hypothetical protein
MRHVQMYECDRGHRFEEDDMGTHRECVTTDPYPMYENWGCCPECGTTDLQKLLQCNGCEEWFFEDELQTCEHCDQAYCAACFTEQLIECRREAGIAQREAYYDRD